MFWVIAIIVVFIVIGAISNASKTSKEISEKAELNEKKRSRADAYSEFVLREQPHERFKGMSKSEIREDIETKISEFKADEDGAHIIPVIIFFAASGVGIFISFSSENWAPAIIGVVGGGFFANNLDKQAVASVEAKYTSQGYSAEKLRIK